MSSDSEPDNIPLAEIRCKDDNIPLAKLKAKHFDIPENRQCNDWESSDEDYDSDRDPEFIPGLCEVKGCKEEVWVACQDCEILVCYDHCIQDIVSCDQHGEVLKALKRKKKLDKREDSKKKKDEEN